MNKNIDKNAKLGLEQFKQEISKELGIENSTSNIFHAGKVGGLMTRRLVEIGENNIKHKK